jgi:fibronectin-binding autotransporter adhesin
LRRAIPIGTLTIVGDATFGATSTFRVEIEPLGTSDLLDVSGTVAISSGATLQVLKQVGSYTAGTEWLVLTAGTGITGAFDDPVLQSAPMLDLAVEYRANPVSGDDMWLVLLSSTVIGVVDIAETPNQIATAYGVEDAGGAVLDAFTGMDEDIARAALDNLSGEVHATAFGAAFDSPWFREGMLARLREAHGGGRPNRPVLAFAPDRASVGAGGGGADTATGASWRWWAVRPEGYLASSKLGADGNAAAATIATGGLILGADGTTGDVTLGFAAGFQKDRIGVSDRNSAADISTWNLGTYAGWTGSDGWRARGGAVAAWHGFATTREIVVPGLESTAEASYSGWSRQLFAEAGRVFDVGGGTAEPYAGLRLAHASRGAFSETGAGAAGLAADAEGRTALIAILGVNVATTVALPDGRWMRPHAGIAWEHAFADMTPSADLMFGGGSDAFHILGPTRGSDTIRLNAGLDVPLSASATAFVAYQGTLASGVHAHAVRAGASIRF